MAIVRHAPPPSGAPPRPLRRARARSGPLLIVSAFAPELVELRRLMRQRPPPVSVPSPGSLQHPTGRPTAGGDVVAQPVGIGLVEAAAGAARLIDRLAPRAVIFVGTAGAYAGPTAPSIGAVVIARRLQLVSAAVVDGGGYLPAALPIAVESTPALLRLLTDARVGRVGSATSLTTGDVATPIAITKTRRLATRLARASGAVAENLEAFSVARAAAAAGVPFAAVLGIANRVGPAAHAEWRRHGARAAAVACAVVAEALPFLLGRAAFTKSDPAPSRRARRRGSAPHGAPARTASRLRAARPPA